VKIVLDELKTDVNEDISAAIITANINSLAPTGIKSITILGYAKFEQPFGFSHTFSQTSGSVQATSSDNFQNNI
jgi:hypothetical protein